jgi:ribosomal protein L15
VENHSGSGARGGGTGKGRGRGRGSGRGGSSSSGSSSKPIGDECRHYGKMGHLARECHSKPMKEQAHVAQDEEEVSLMLTLSTLIRPEVISSCAEVEIHEEKVFAHLDEEKEHMSGCRTTFMKIDTTMLGTVCFSDDSVARIKGRGAVVFVCMNGESRSFDGVYFIPHLTTNIVSVG